MEERISAIESRLAALEVQGDSIKQQGTVLEEYAKVSKTLLEEIVEAARGGLPGKSEEAPTAMRAAKSIVRTLRSSGVGPRSTFAQMEESASKISPNKKNKVTSGSIDDEDPPVEEKLQEEITAYDETSSENRPAGVATVSQKSPTGNTRSKSSSRRSPNMNRTLKLCIEPW